MFWGCSVYASSQVGINTLFPIGNFIIDTNGDNISATPTPTQFKNDVVFSKSTDNEAILGVGAMPYNSAQLYLNSNNKALGLNKVTLASSFDVVTVPNPTDGIVVYNKDATIDDGVYFFSDTQWGKMATNIYAGSFINLLNLSSPDVVTKPITPAQLSAELYSTGVELKFVTKENGAIEILEDGAYSFNMHLSGYVSTGSSEFAYYYVFLVNDTNHSVADSYTVALRPNSNAQQTASVFLNANFKKNDVVKIYVCHESETNRIWSLKSSAPGSNNLVRSYMVFWKL